MNSSQIDAQQPPQQNLSAPSSATTTATTTTTVTGDVSPDYLPTVVTVAYLVIAGESLIHLATLVIAAINLLVLGSTQLLHQNLKLVLMCQSGAVGFFEIFRLATILQKILSNDMFNPCFVFLQMSLMFLGMFHALTIHVLFIERLIAAILLEKYESYKKITFSICWIFVTLFLSFINVLTNCQSWTTTTLNLITSFVMLFMSFVECIFIAIIGIYSREKFEKQMENVKHISSFLGARYQLAENMKTSRQLFPAFFCNFLINFFCIFTPLNFVFKWVTNAHAISMIIATQIALSSVLNTVVEATIINHHPALKKRFDFLLNKILRCHGDTGSSNNQVVHANITNSTIKSANCVGDVNDFEEHFKMIELQWK